MTIGRADARALPLADCSVDAIVTDPPYGLAELPIRVIAKTLSEWLDGNRDFVPDGRGFMSRQWDRFVPPPAAWDEAYRVLKPGGYLLAFSGARTVDLMGLSIRLAGFEQRDSIGMLGWITAQGFPKSRDVSKAIDKMAGAEREVIGKYVHPALGPDWASYPSCDKAYADGPTFGRTGGRDVTAPATEDATRWQGWGTALKPAWEPIVVARKPLTGSVAANVLAYGTGALNVDACRVEGAWSDRPTRTPNDGTAGGLYRRNAGSFNDIATEQHPAGRWPPNLLIVHHPDCAQTCEPNCHVAEMDAQSGVRTSGARSANGRADTTHWRIKGGNSEASTGSASRFYPVFKFQPKAPTKERPVIVRNGQRHSHPTVKPLGLMRWLVRLVTPPGGLVLDPFCGSGATLEAAQLEGFRAVGFDTDPDAMEWTAQRLGKYEPDLFAAL